MTIRAFDWHNYKNQTPTRGAHDISTLQMAWWISHSEASYETPPPNRILHRKTIRTRLSPSSQWLFCAWALVPRWLPPTRFLHQKTKNGYSLHASDYCVRGRWLNVWYRGQNRFPANTTGGSILVAIDGWMGEPGYGWWWWSKYQ